MHNTIANGCRSAEQNQFPSQLFNLLLFEPAPKCSPRGNSNICLSRTI